MKARFHFRQLVAIFLIACALGAGGVYWYRTRRVAPSSDDLVVYLPTANASVLYIDVAAMRRSGILDMLAGSKATEEPDYRQFVAETNFDYRRDMDAVAAAFKDGRIYFALRGRFRWNNLKDYAERHGGSCHNDFCVLAGSQPNRRISFYPLKRDVLAMAVSPDDFAAYQVTGQAAKFALAPSQDPVWATIPAVALRGMDSLPFAARVFVPALQGTDQIVFSISADRDLHLQLGLHVTCTDAPAASTLLTQFERATHTLSELLTHQRQPPDPADFSRVLVAGTFRRDERQVYGTWPISKAFVDAIAGSGY
ncbi:MAG: hypothetical protein M3O26_01835 [Pseudomonadota bacterium]|nr:hypothetical protein [Pseudomonadota bacterium]